MYRILRFLGIGWAMGDMIKHILEFYKMTKGSRIGGYIEGIIATPLRLISVTVVWPLNKIIDKIELLERNGFRGNPELSPNDHISDRSCLQGEATKEFDDPFFSDEDIDESYISELSRFMVLPCP